MKHIKNPFSILCFLIFGSASALAEPLSEYENHYIKMNQLKSELEQLELEKKIQAVEMELLKNKMILEGDVDLNLKSNNPNDIISLQQQKKQRELPPPAFSPRELQIQYILGTGKNKMIVFTFNGQKQTLKSGQKFNGWMMKIMDKKIQFTKGMRKSKYEYFNHQESRYLFLLCRI